MKINMHFNITIILIVLTLSILVYSHDSVIFESPEGEVHNHGYCSVPLGIARDSINIQVGFSVNPPPEEPPGGQQQAQDLNDRTYIQVEFQSAKFISGIITQGSSSSDSRVTHFKVQHSQDCVHFNYITERDDDRFSENELDPAIFAANIEPNTTTTTMFDRVFMALCVRVVPTRRIGDETAMRFELIGCDKTVCQSELVPVEIKKREYWKMFLFDSEKIVTAIKMTMLPGTITGIPGLIVSYSRTCNFYFGAKFLKSDDGSPIFTPELGSDMIIINETSFPIRAQCFAVSSPDPEMDLTKAPSFSRQILADEYQVSFEGCDALEPHEALSSCGKTRVNSHHRGKRVVGGTPTLPGEWPWLVSLHFLKNHSFLEGSGLRHLCGASLIHPQWVLTAAHCVDNASGDGLDDRDNWHVVLGEHYQRHMDGTEQVMSVEKIVKHPDFVLEPFTKILHDIALIKLSVPASLSDYVNTICIEPNYTFPDGTTCVTAGWGYVKVEGGVGVELPNHAEVKIIPQHACAEKYDILPDYHETKSAVAIEDSVLCAMAEQNGIDSCAGDSGGPLICYHDGHWTQVGVVSIGYLCGDIRYPAIYTRVNHFYDWIDEVISTN